jgi:hypothetical protein
MQSRSSAIPGRARVVLRLSPGLLGLSLACLSPAACSGGGEDGTAGGGGDGPIECAPGEARLEDGRCQPPGLPLDMKCPPGETPLEDGSCQAAGVPPDRCGVGFAADGEGGCEPVLPVEACPEGQMAIPGETECHEVAPCGTGTWGDIPIEPDTVFVDGAYADDDSDGTEDKPWKTVQEGIIDAPKGAIVAIAAGVYPEEITIASQWKRLWGRCPSMVTIEGFTPDSAAVVVVADGSELHGLGVTGSGIGVYFAGAQNASFDRIWLHDTGSAAAVADGDAAVTVRGSLIERSTGTSVQVQKGSALTIEGSVVRDILPAANDQSGRAVEAFAGALRSSVTVRTSLIERASDTGLFFNKADVLIEDVAVRDMAPVAGATYGVGIALAAQLSNVTVRGSTIERAYTTGIELTGSQATLERVTVKETLPLPYNDIPATGIQALPHEPTGTPTVLTLLQSVVARSPSTGVSVFQSSALIESTLVRDNLHALEEPTEDPVAAVALLIASGNTVRHSVITGNRWYGLALAVGDVLFEGSVVRDAELEVGAAVCAGNFPIPGFPPGTLTLRSSLLEDCAGAGALAVDSHLVIETSVIRGVLPTAHGFGGDAVELIHGTTADGTLVIRGSLLDAPARAGGATFGGPVDIGTTAITCAGHDLVAEQGGSYTDAGDTVCGCPDATEACAPTSPGLEPPL